MERGVGEQMKQLVFGFNEVIPNIVLLALNRLVSFPRMHF